MSLFLISCATNNQDRLNQAARDTAEASQVDEAIQQTRQLPEQPADCKRIERAGIKDGERLDIALVKTDRALSRANNRISRCAGWYEDLRESRKAAVDVNE